MSMSIDHLNSCRLTAEKCITCHTLTFLVDRNTVTNIPDRLPRAMLTCVHLSRGVAFGRGATSELYPETVVPGCFTGGRIGRVALTNVPRICRVASVKKNSAKSHANKSDSPPWQAGTLHGAFSKLPVDVKAFVDPANPCVSGVKRARHSCNRSSQRVSSEARRVADYKQIIPLLL